MVEPATQSRFEALTGCTPKEFAGIASCFFGIMIAGSESSNMVLSVSAGSILFAVPILIYLHNERKRQEH